MKRSDRTGSAFVLCLVVLLTGVSLTALVQSHLFERSAAQRARANDTELRAALLLALREAMTRLADDEDRGVDYPGEAWATPREARTDSGAHVRFHLRCGQDRFNLNNLTIPQADHPARSPWDMLADLLAARTTPPPAAALRNLRETVSATPPTWVDSAQVGPEISGPELAALPRPASGPSTINLNSASPEVLRALAGPGREAWVDAVVTARKEAPLRSADAALSLLPPLWRSQVALWVDVRSEFVEFMGEAERDHTVKRLSALLRRDRAGNVEVLACRW